MDKRVELSQVTQRAIEEIPEQGVTCNRYFSGEIGFAGTVFISNEYVLISCPENEASVFKIHSFLSIYLNGTTKLLAKGEEFRLIKNVEGVIEKNFWTGFGHIPKARNGIFTFINTDKFLRKVIIYQGRNPDTQIVTDFDRREHNLHYHVTVPPWIEKNDMVLVQGEAINQLWHARVVHVDRNQKVLTALFYIATKRDPNLFIRESLVRTAKNNLSFKSIVGVANGSWLSSTIWKQDN